MYIPLTSGGVAVIDDADAAAVTAHSWYGRRSGRTTYVRRASDGLALHTFLLPDAPLVDHRNGDGQDNRRENLRPASRQQNGANARVSAANTSGFKGVAWHARAGKWEAYIKVDRQKRYLGLHIDPEDAARAYDEAARAAFGEFAALNFPEDGEVAA